MMMCEGEHLGFAESLSSVSDWRTDVGKFSVALFIFEYFKNWWIIRSFCEIHLINFQRYYSEFAQNFLDSMDFKNYYYVPSQQTILGDSI